ncbi:MAG TPA: PilZ domain-containing protein [Candidatus Acidoferrales bacterium]|nr:PilZ domain-containing protein [Candidatus Acidoferrales bacterium]
MHHGSNKGPNRVASAAVEETDRRTGDRHLFTASAEVVELTSGARFATRTTDLGPGGCFIDTTNPFPVGAKVRVSIHKGKNRFNTPGTVVYSQQGLGMGISFTGLDQAQQHAIEAWIRGSYDETPGYVTTSEFDSKKNAADQGISPRVAMMRLIRALVTKGILTETEAASILVDPVI